MIIESPFTDFYDGLANKTQNKNEVLYKRDEQIFKIKKTTLNFRSYIQFEDPNKYINEMIIGFCGTIYHIYELYDGMIYYDLNDLKVNKYILENLKINKENIYKFVNKKNIFNIAPYFKISTEYKNSNSITNDIILNLNFNNLESAGFAKIFNAEEIYNHLDTFLRL